MKIYCIILCLLFSLPLFSRNREKEGVVQDTLIKTRTYVTVPSESPSRLRNISPRKGHWSFEGSYGMAFGDQTTIEISPQVKYNWNPYFSVGGGLSYSHYYYSRKGYKEKWNYLGLDLFARITPFPYLALQVQPELLERWGKSDGRKVSGRIVPVFLAGGGFQIPAGPGSVNIMFFYDIIQNKYTPYGDGLYYTLGYSFRFR